MSEALNLLGLTLLLKRKRHFLSLPLFLDLPLLCGGSRCQTLALGLFGLTLLLKRKRRFLSLPLFLDLPLLRGGFCC